MSKSTNEQGGIPLKQIRKALSMSQSEFAALLGVQGFTVSRWETGKAEAQLDTEQILTLDEQLASIGHRFIDFGKAGGSEIQNA